MLSVATPIQTVLGPSETPYVLLVDDHQPSLQSLSQVVERSGYRCVMAGSATEALARCDAQRPQVVVTDLSMPNMDGCGLALWLNSRYPSIPLLLMTGQELDASDLEDLRRTFTAVFPKPVDIEWFLRWIDRLMPQSGMSRRP